MRFGILFLILLSAAKPKVPAWEKDWLQGMELFKKARYADAAPHFQKVVQVLPDGFAGQAMLGKCLMNAGDQAAALEPLQRAWSLKPDDGDTAIRTLTVLMGLKRYPEILQQVQVRPSEAIAPEYRGDVYRLAGLAAWNLKDTGLAMDAFRHAENIYAGLDPETAGLQSRRAEVLSWLVRLLNKESRGMAGAERSRRYAESMERARTLILLDPSSENLLAAAEAALGSGGYPEAEALARRAAIAAPENGFVRLYIGQALSHLGRFREAVPPLEEAVRLLPVENRATAHNQLGFVLEKLGETRRAIEAYRQAGNLERVRMMQEISGDGTPVQQ
jgi:tetratricopeptide (TPR) repeat protein